MRKLLLLLAATDVFVLKGFTNRGYVPINFPHDICMLHVANRIFAAALTLGKSINEPTEVNTLTVFLRQDGSFKRIHEYQSKHLTKMDCHATQDAGYVAVVNSLTDSDVREPDELLSVGSFVLRITLEDDQPKVETFQKFAYTNQKSVSLWSRNQGSLYLIYTYNTTQTSQLCTIYKLGNTHFNPLGDVPCQNANVVEFFTVHHDLFVFVGNNRDSSGSSNTFSSIMRWNLEQQKFLEHQKIYTNAIVVARYFYLDHNHQRQHFLFIGNSFEVNEFNVINYDVPSLIYKFVNGFFIPLQTINVRHIKAAVPILGKRGEFHFLIASEDREVQIFFYDGWKFQESPIEFTGEAFGAGIESLRVYDNIINGSSTIGKLKPNHYELDV